MLRKTALLLWRSGQRALNRLLRAHKPVQVMISATPKESMGTLLLAAKPSRDRLHLRNLFLAGRRYHIYKHEDSLMIHTTSVIPWRRRHRTRIAAVMFCHLQDIGSGITQITLTARMTLMFFLDIFIVPLWMGLLLIFGPMSLTAGVACSLIILALSIYWHRNTAIMQALDMIYFVQVALDDLAPAEVMALPERTDHVIMTGDKFREEWHKFYEEHQPDERESPV